MAFLLLIVLLVGAIPLWISAGAYCDYILDPFLLSQSRTLKMKAFFGLFSTLYFVGAGILGLSLLAVLYQALLKVI